MSAAPRKKVLIVGAGAFGISTALYLQRFHAHCIDVLLLDSQPFPSVNSASGHDTSRAVRPDYADPFYAKLGRETVNTWKTDPVFSNHYKESGRIGASAPGVLFANQSRDVLKALDYKLEEYSGEDGVEKMQKRFPKLGNKELLKGWDFYFNPAAGWANPRESVIAGMKEYQRLQGAFIGHAQKGFVIENILSGSRIAGVKTADGQSHPADHVIYATGAFTNDTLLPGLDTQIYPIGFALAHWKLDAPGELEAWLDHPVVDMYHHGYFFPPDPKTKLMKLGLGIVAFTNDTKGDAASVGKALPNSSLKGTPLEARIPILAEDGIRYVLRRWAPSLADKKFFDMRLCWDAMTADGGWLIDHHPEIEGLSVATGGSGHGFKFLPVVGQYICEALDIAQPGPNASITPKTYAQKQEMRRRWRWGREANINVKDRRVVLQGRPILELKDYFKPGAPTKIDSWTRSKL